MAKVVSHRKNCKESANPLTGSCSALGSFQKPDVGGVSPGGGQANVQSNLHCEAFSIECGAYDTIFYDKPGELSAVPSSAQTQYSPKNSKCRTETIDLSSFDRIQDVYIKFRNINQYDQALYFYNIKLGKIVINKQDLTYCLPVICCNKLKYKGLGFIKRKDEEAVKFNLYGLDVKLIDTIFSKFYTPISASTNVKLWSLSGQKC